MSESTGANGRFYMSSETSRQLREAMMNASPLQAIQEEWNGEGVPPVGAECEAVRLELPDGGGRDFEPALIKGYFYALPGRQVWFSTGEGEDFVHLLANVDFRPIRTQAQTDRTQLLKALNQLRAETDMGVIADAIIEMGFRLERQK